MGCLGLLIFPPGYQFFKMSIDAEIMAENRNPRWRPSAILGRPPSWNCCYIIQDHPRSFFIGPHQHVNFMQIRCIVLKVWRFDFFYRFGLKCLFHASKISVFGVWTPKRDWSSSRPPKGTSLAGTAITWWFWWKSVQRCDLGASQWNQKRKAMKETYCGKLGVRPDHPRCRSDMWSCMLGGLREIVLSFKFHQWSRLKGFQCVWGGRN